MTRKLCLAGALLALLVGLASADETGTIQGRVLDHGTHQAVIAAAVEVMGTDLGANTDEEGHYTIQGVPAGPQAIRASAMGYEARQPTDVIVLPGRSTQADFEMYSKVIRINDVGTGDWTGCVNLSVVDSLSDTPISARLLVADGNGKSAHRQPGLNWFPPGDYNVTTDNPLYVAKRISIHVVDACTTAIQIRLTSVWSDSSGLGVVSGLVTDSGFGSPVPGARIKLNPGGKTAMTDGVGRFTVQSSIGRFTLEVERPPYGKETRGVLVARESTTVADFALTYHRKPDESTLLWLYGFQWAIMEGSQYTSDSPPFRHHNDSLRKVAFRTYQGHEGQFAIRQMAYSVEGDPIYTCLVVNHDSCALIRDGRLDHYLAGDFKLYVYRVSRIELFRFGYDPELKVRIEEPANENSPDRPGFMLKLIFPDGKSDWF